MFVLPPPPRYPAQVAYAAAAANGYYVPGLETTNEVTTDEKGDWTLQAGEGQYVMKDDLRLAIPPPHPTETSSGPPNPLETAAAPARAGLKLSLVSLHGRQPPQLYKLNSTTSDLRKVGIQESDRELGDDGDSSSQNGSQSLTTTSKSVFGQGNALLVTAPATGKDAAKRRKPRTYMVKSGSSFLSRVIVHESFTKRTAEHDPNGLYAFVNNGRSFLMLDLSSPTKTDPLIKVLFAKAHALCHAVNPATKNSTHVDCIIGTTESDIFWLEGLTARYSRLNKNGIINKAAVKSIKWIPGSENLFMVAHYDGTLIVYDKEKDDSNFFEEGEKLEAASNETNGHSASEKTDGPTLRVLKSVNSKNQKMNPVAVWKVSNHCINEIAFSPDQRYLAVVSEDGSLRVLDYINEKLLDVFHSYFGGIICVCWSPDSKYILTGGQDDVITIWSYAERKIIARCHGHYSWITSVAFDPWRCDGKNYRFGSVGEDGRLALWDFSLGTLHRPKGTIRPAPRNSISHTRHRTDSASTNLLRTETTRSYRPDSADSKSKEATVHAVEPRNAVAQLTPIFLSKMIYRDLTDEEAKKDPDADKKVVNDPLTWIGFEEDCIIAGSKDGHIRTWIRPSEIQAAAASVKAGNGKV